MSAPAEQRTPYKQPPCQIEEHALCLGPGEIRLTSQAEWERPIETLRCACTCHTH